MEMTLLTDRKPSTEETYTELLRQYYPRRSKLTIKEAALQLNRPVGTIQKYAGNGIKRYDQSFEFIKKAYWITLEALAKLLHEEGLMPVPPDSVSQARIDQLWEKEKQQKRKANAKPRKSTKPCQLTEQPMSNSDECTGEVSLAATESGICGRFTVPRGEGVETNQDASIPPFNSATGLSEKAGRNVHKSRSSRPVTEAMLFNPAARLRQVLQRLAGSSGASKRARQIMVTRR